MIIEVKTPIKAIRAKCIDCCAGSKNEVKLCTCTDCSLYPYRMGKRPKNKTIRVKDVRNEINS